MKYIRTKDGVYEVDNEFFDYVGKEYKRASWNEIQLVIAQANTIEELCDCVVCVKDKTHAIYLPSEPNIPVWEETYVAIWTKWGLKYVAKRNEKGEFELI